MFGLTPEDYPDVEIEIWPENARAVDLFKRVLRQWRIGATGPVAFDSNVILGILSHMSISGDEALALLDDLQVMEDAALDAMYKKETT